MSLTVPEPPRSRPAAVSTYRLTAPNAPETPRLARNHVAELLGTAGLWQLVEPARLLVSEVVTNVYRHTPVGEVTVRTALHTDRVVIAVADAAPEEMPGRGGADEECGRGLVLLAAMAAAWGVSWQGEEKAVWFELRRSEGGG